MQTLLQIICNSKQSSSLRRKIVKDKSLEDFGLVCSEEKNNYRAEGWSKIHCFHENAVGAINVQWDQTTKTLSARIITKNNNNPSIILGAFVEYLFQRHSKVIKALNIYPIE